MANRGAALEISGPEPFLPFSHAHAKKAEKDALLETWTELRHKIPECRQTKLFMPNPDIPLSKNLLRHTKKELCLLLRHMIGHSFLSYHQSLIHPGTPPQCRLCGYIREESHHIIKHCPALANIRLECLWQTVVDDVCFIPGLLTFLQSKQITTLETWDTNSNTEDADKASDADNPADMAAEE
jgi:hypothetical protein